MSPTHALRTFSLFLMLFAPAQKRRGLVHKVSSVVACVGALGWKLSRLVTRCQPKTGPICTMAIRGTQRMSSLLRRVPCCGSDHGSHSQR